MLAPRRGALAQSADNICFPCSRLAMANGPSSLRIARSLMDGTKRIISATEVVKCVRYGLGRPKGEVAGQPRGVGDRSLALRRYGG